MFRNFIFLEIGGGVCTKQFKFFKMIIFLVFLSLLPSLSHLIPSLLTGIQDTLLLLNSSLYRLLRCPTLTGFINKTNLSLSLRCCHYHHNYQRKHLGFFLIFFSSSKIKIYPIGILFCKRKIRNIFELEIFIFFGFCCFLLEGRLGTHRLIKNLPFYLIFTM